MHDENLDTFISGIAAEECLPLPRDVPRDDSDEWDHLTWEDIEPQEAALERIWSGRAAEVLARDFGRFQCAVRAEGSAPGVSWLYLFAEESLPSDRSVLFWTVDGAKKNWNFARRLTLQECETLMRLAAKDAETG